MIALWTIIQQVVEIINTFQSMLNRELALALGYFTQYLSAYHHSGRLTSFRSMPPLLSARKAVRISYTINNKAKFKENIHREVSFECPLPVSLFGSCAPKLEWGNAVISCSSVYTYVSSNPTSSIVTANVDIVPAPGGYACGDRRTVVDPSVEVGAGARRTTGLRSMGSRRFSMRREIITDDMLKAVN
jgi:hypothetical protein